MKPPTSLVGERRHGIFTRPRAWGYEEWAPTAARRLLGASPAMAERYWLVHPNGARQLIDPRQFDLMRLAEQARQIGGRLVIESVQPQTAVAAPSQSPAAAAPGFELPIGALGPLFKSRFAQIHDCEVDYSVDINSRPTNRVLGGYYKKRRLVRVYSHDRVRGRRPVEELFDTFLHEMAHHLEYTEPQTFEAARCQRVHGMMHSPLFWKILGDLKRRWGRHQYRYGVDRDA